MTDTYSNRIEKERSGRPAGRPPIGPQWPTVLDEPKISCPNCGSTLVTVYKTERIEIRHIRRHRKCSACGATHRRDEEISTADAETLRNIGE